MVQKLGTIPWTVDTHGAKYDDMHNFHNSPCHTREGPGNNNSYMSEAIKF